MDYPGFCGEVDLVCIRPVHYILVFEEEENAKMMVSLKQESRIIGVIQIAKLKKAPQQESFEFSQNPKESNAFIQEQNAVDKLAQLITITLRARKSSWK
jgi:hypothetical protein